ncbi:MAG: hypothetical protein AAB036_09160 [Elusimicrobiota bacterium]
METRFSSRMLRGKRGQTAIEYLLTTVALVTVFVGMFGFLQGQLKRLFTIAGVKILSTYPK